MRVSIPLYALCLLSACRSDDTQKDTALPTDDCTWYADTDGDGFGDPDSSASGACDAAPSGHVADATDCDDTNPDIWPGADEYCNGLDDDCDGEVDEDALDATTWYTDADADGFGDPASSVSDCTAPSGTVADATDCDDGNVDIWPGAPERCDGLDNDCDGEVDEDLLQTWYADADGDGFGDADTPWLTCEPGTGWLLDATDCDDSNSAIHPDATETCDGLDNDCDGLLDDQDDSLSDGSTWYTDADNDAFGDPASSTVACLQPAGHVADATDCDDTNPDTWPGADEYCNGMDDDCDGSVDEDALDAPTWYTDADSDGFGDPASAVADCTAPGGTVADATDCDDTNPDIWPGADEYCNGLDDDCDGSVDDGALDATTWYPDDDCDGYGATSGVSACESPGDDYLTDSTDCDDSDARSNPDQVEICDGLDNNCDGSVDESCESPVEIAAPSLDPVDSPTSPGACALIGETVASPDPHSLSNMSSFMDMLTGATSGLYSSTEEVAEILDYSIRYGSDYTASVGNYSPTTSWPVLATSGDYGAARFRGYLNIGCGDPLNVTIGLIGNDALALYIEGDYIVGVNWNDGQWKKFRYLSFPEPGLYSFEVQWSTNLCCTIDPFELVWAQEFVAGYDNYDSMCASASCTYGDGVAIPGFDVISGDYLVSASDGEATTCAQCEADADCGSGESCNTAGICE